MIPHFHRHTAIALSPLSLIYYHYHPFLHHTIMSDALAKKHEELLAKMEQTKKETNDGAAANTEEDDTDRLLSHAIEVAIQQGKGWTTAERDEYLKKILDDDYLPPLFASTPEELEKSGLAEAFSSLVYEGQSPHQLYLEFKQKGNDAFSNGQRNEAKNVQYYRDAVNHYYEALAWAKQIPSSSSDETGTTATTGETTTTTTRHPDDPVYKDTELDEIKSTLCSNAALAHLQLRNWGHARDDSNKVKCGRTLYISDVGGLYRFSHFSRSHTHILHSHLSFSSLT
jgi:hypothetical protein